jgi:hypothetical protein
LVVDGLGGGGAADPSVEPVEAVFLVVAGRMSGVEGIVGIRDAVIFVLGWAVHEVFMCGSLRRKGRVVFLN